MAEAPIPGSVNYRQLISDLKRRLVKVEKTIQQLEGHEHSKGQDRRGRKSMGDAEREEVSARMKAYWQRERERKATAERV